MCGKAVCMNKNKILNTFRKYRHWHMHPWFLFPHLVVYDTEVSLPLATVEPAAKRAKIRTDVHGNQVERKLKLKWTHELSSYSMATNVLGFEGEEIFKCREGDTENGIKKFARVICDKIDFYQRKKLCYSEWKIQRDHKCPRSRCRWWSSVFHRYREKKRPTNLKL